MKPRSVSYLFRKRQPGFHSVEGVFATTIAEVRKSRLVEVLELPHCGGIGSVMKNLLTFSWNSNTIYHLTGAENYMALRTGRNSVLTIHDIGSAFLGNFLKVFVIKVLWFWIPAILVKQITVISEASMGEVVGLMPFAKRKIRVIHNPLDPRYSFSPKEFRKQRPIILHIGTKPNKNLERTIEALRGIDCHLVIIGKLSVHQQELLESRSVSYTNAYDVSFETLYCHYQQCDMVCFASTYEGFGMPIIESQAVGRVVVTSNCSSMPEVAGEGAHLVDPLCVGSIREGILRVIDDDEYREALIQKGLSNIARFRPEEIALVYQKVYTEIEAEY